MNLVSSERQLKRPVVPEFEFIHTTNNDQYSGPGSRTVARSHVMRNFHRQKGRPKSQPSKLPGPLMTRFRYQEVSQAPHVASSSVTFSPELQVIPQRGQDVASTSEEEQTPDSVIEGDKTSLDSTIQEQVGGLGHGFASWLKRRPYQNSFPLSISNLWALPIDIDAYELIYHRKLPFPHQIAFGASRLVL
jgi:hypothetical protein